MRIAAAQIAPVLLDRGKTIARMAEAIHDAGRQGCGLVAFGESILPGYPMWLHRTDGARFEDDRQKELFSLYSEQAVELAGQRPAMIADLCDAAQEHGIAVVFGAAERDPARGHSLFCSRVIIGPDGNLMSVQRKLKPTYEERLVWSDGDTNGLKTHQIGGFRVGGLNCWENWMPLARASLYQQGLDLHVMLWPGSSRLTKDITRFVAREGRCWVLSASALMRPEDIPADFPHRDAICSEVQDIDGEAAEGHFYDGGSCLASPTGEWKVEPTAKQDGLIISEIDMDTVRRERLTFDPAGHYSRPDLLSLRIG